MLIRLGLQVQTEIISSIDDLYRDGVALVELKLCSGRFFGQRAWPDDGERDVTSSDEVLALSPPVLPPSENGGITLNPLSHGNKNGHSDCRSCGSMVSSGRYSP